MKTITKYRTITTSGRPVVVHAFLNETLEIDYEFSCDGFDLSDSEKMRLIEVASERARNLLATQILLG